VGEFDIKMAHRAVPLIKREYRKSPKWNVEVRRVHNDVLKPFLYLGLTFNLLAPELFF